MCCMPVSPLFSRVRILPCNPFQLWQIARPIKEKLFGSPKTRWPHVAAQTSPSHCLHPPWDLTSEGSWVTAFVISSEMERAEKHGDCRRTGQLAPAPTAKLPMSYTHTYSRWQLSLKWFTSPVLSLIFIGFILCCILLMEMGVKVKTSGKPQIIHDTWIVLDFEQKIFLLLWQDCGITVSFGLNDGPQCACGSRNGGRVQEIRQQGGRAFCEAG